MCIRDSNLISLSVTESVENLVNQVVIYDKNDTLVKVQKNDELIGLYGLMQAYLRKEAGKDSDSQAARLLEDSGPSQKLSVKTVSYTHLDVYKRQPVFPTPGACAFIR